MTTAQAKTGKNTGLSQKNSFFQRENGRFFPPALFARAMCGAGKGVLGEWFRLQRGVSRVFPEFPPLSSWAPKVLGP
jgi:hypothetical protein